MHKEYALSRNQAKLTTVLPTQMKEWTEPTLNLCADYM